MEAVYGWIKSIIYYMIFLSVANNLLADSKYEKYVRFFAGMVLVLLVVSPFTSSLRLDKQILALFQSITFQNDAEDLRVDLWVMDDKRLEQIISKYEEAVRTDVTAMAEAEGLSCIQAQVTIDRDRDSSRYGQVTDIQLELQGEKQRQAQSNSYIESRLVNVESNQIGIIQVEPVTLEEENEGKERSPQAQAVEENAPREISAQNKIDPNNEPEKKTGGEAGKTEEELEGVELQQKIDGFTGKVASYYGLERSHIKVWRKND